MRVISRVAEACANGVIEPFDGQVLRPSLWWTAPQQGRDHTGIAEAIEPERGRYSYFGNHGSAQCRPDRATYVHADAVCSHGGIQHRLWDPFGKGRGRERD